MSNTKNKDDLKDFETLNKKFDEYTENYEDLSLIEFDMVDTDHKGIFNFEVKGRSVDVVRLTLIENFIKNYYDDFVYVHIEYYNGFLNITYNGVDLK